MDISKKDLLLETGISYGQLYRWKREGLIPEEWFIKKSSYTGQETYFPKEAILKRIATIQELKDHYSLEEMAKLLTPEISNRLFSEDDLAKFEEIDVEVAACFMDLMEKDEFTFREVVVMIALNRWIDNKQLDENQQKRILRSTVNMLAMMKTIDYIMLLLHGENEYYVMLLQEGTTYFIDEQLQVEQKIHLDELGSNIKMKYKQVFQFAFDEEGESL